MKKVQLGRIERGGEGLNEIEEDSSKHVLQGMQPSYLHCFVDRYVAVLTPPVLLTCLAASQNLHKASSRC